MKIDPTDDVLEKLLADLCRAHGIGPDYLKSPAGRAFIKATHERVVKEIADRLFGQLVQHHAKKAKR